MTPISGSSLLTGNRHGSCNAGKSGAGVCASARSSRDDLHRVPARGSIAHNSSGFTLLEILLVLTIIGMASVLVVPNLTGMEARTFSAQLRQANAMLNYARRIAVVSGQTSTVSLYAGSEQDVEPGQISEDSTEQANIVARWEASGVELRFRDSTDKEIQIDDKIYITFYPEGGSSGGTLLFSEDERQATVLIDPFTGRISSTYGED